MNTQYKVLTQELVVSGLHSLLDNQMDITSFEGPSFNDTDEPFKLLEIRVVCPTPIEYIDAPYMSHVCGTDMLMIGDSGSVFEGIIKGETFVIIFE